ncbi:YlbD family protein [Metabacillus sp. KIGAM252]|uniref:YlbD family protein n=1 Tax=Metabacillus flavus TaxID=2823519 RepID=A0ABS5LDR1_9BACI|nr:YlbD family protein [Metabacillus flavus]MBS2968846.1 YlbD family protein [Metabacillus flavus]
MATKKLHPKVEEFKEFVRKHPKMIQEAKKGTKTWQEYYENWYLLGENDAYWDDYKDARQEEKETDEEKGFVTQLFSAVKKMDANEMNISLSKMSNAVSTVQNLLETFGVAKGSGGTPSNGGSRPFSFRKD